MKTNMYLLFRVFALFFAGNLLAADTTPPTIYLNGGKRQNVQIGSTFILNEPKAVSDNETDSADIEVELSWNVNGPVNASKRGEYWLFILATDLSGNYYYDTVIYTVDDFIPPVINLNTPDMVCVQLNSVYNRVQPSVSDNYYSAGQISLVLISSDVNVNLMGLYTDQYKATDGSGNITYKNRIVEVKDCNASGLQAIGAGTFGFYPNPARDIVYLDVPYTRTEWQVQVFSLDGKTLLRRPMLQSRQIDISGLESGLYLISVYDGERRYTEKIQILR